MVRRAKDKQQNCRFVILTFSGGKRDFLAAVRAGVDGYVMKEALPEEI
ncbi:MAG: hypothetical protein ACOX8W_05830 [bacterium]